MRVDMLFAVFKYLWIVSPSSTEVSRNWYRNDAVTSANSMLLVIGLYQLVDAQLKNPGYDM